MEVMLENPELEARARLIQVATKLFAEKGLDGVTIRDLAKEADLNVSLISYYFGGKVGLYRTVLIEFVQQAQTNLMKSLNEFQPDALDEVSFRRHMKAIIDHILRMKTDHPNMTALMQRESLDGLPYARDIYEGVLSSMGASIVEVLRVAQIKKIIREDLNIYFHFLSMVHSIDMLLVSQKCQGPWKSKLFELPSEIDLAIDQIFKVFVEGILQ